jgi:phage terminase large subunit-like protein
VHATGNSQYPGWMGSGRLTVTPGNVIDFSWIEADLVDFASRFAIQAVAFDPFQATQLSTRMLAEGLPMIEVRPTVLNFSEPMKTLEALVLQGKLIHDGDPVLGWMVSNVVAHLDAKDNIYPRKERPENKIDGIVALIMALSRAITPGTQVVLGADYELGTVACWGLVDSGTYGGGNLWIYAVVTTPPTITSGSTASFAMGTLTVQIDN